MGSKVTDSLEEGGTNNNKKFGGGTCKPNGRQSSNRCFIKGREEREEETVTLGTVNAGVTRGHCRKKTNAQQTGRVGGSKENTGRLEGLNKHFRGSSNAYSLFRKCDARPAHLS